MAPSCRAIISDRAARFFDLHQLRSTRRPGRLNQSSAGAGRLLLQDGEDLRLVRIAKIPGRLSHGMAKAEFTRNAVIAGAEYVLAKSIEDVQRVGL
jgi:hypothetical protein